MATIASAQLHLGIDECESCGVNSNYLEWDWDGNWLRVTVRVGCYGTRIEYLDSAADVDDFINEFVNHHPDRAHDLTRMGQQFQELLNPALVGVQSHINYDELGSTKGLIEALVEGRDYAVLDYDDRPWSD